MEINEMKANEVVKLKGRFNRKTITTANGRFVPLHDIPP